MSRQEPRHIKSIVGANIKAAREATGLTQRQLAERVDTDAMSVSRWERGRVLPGVANLVALGDALGCEPLSFYEAPNAEAAA